MVSAEFKVLEPFRTPKFVAAYLADFQVLAHLVHPNLMFAGNSRVSVIPTHKKQYCLT